MEILNYTEYPHFVDIFDEVRFGQVHLVSAASPLLVLRNIVMVLNQLGSDESWPFIEKVNTANDANGVTGLGPAKMSVIPLTKYGNRDDFGKQDLMRRHIEDCFRLNEEEMKCPDLLFDLELSPEFDGDLALGVLCKFIAEDHQFTATQKVFILPADFDPLKMQLEKF